eukprot:Pgem_evm1s7917
MNTSGNRLSWIVATIIYAVLFSCLLPITIICSQKQKEYPNFKHTSMVSVDKLLQDTNQSATEYMDKVLNIVAQDIMKEKISNSSDRSILTNISLNIGIGFTSTYLKEPLQLQYNASDLFFRLGKQLQPVLRKYKANITAIQNNNNNSNNNNNNNDNNNKAINMLADRISHDLHELFIVNYKNDTDADLNFLYDVVTTISEYIVPIVLKERKILILEGYAKNETKLEKAYGRANIR